MTTYDLALLDLTAFVILFYAYIKLLQGYKQSIKTIKKIEEESISFQKKLVVDALKCSLGENYLIQAITDSRKVSDHKSFLIAKIKNKDAVVKSKIKKIMESIDE